MGEDSITGRSVKTFPPSTMIPVEELNAIVARTWGEALLARGFRAVAPRLWVRTRLDFARDVFELRATKGASYALEVGLCLNFAPHIQSGVLRWHRTPKSVRTDLSLHDDDLQVGRTLTLLGTRESEAAFAQTRAPLDVAVAETRLNRVHTLAELLTAFETERARPSPGLGFYNYIQHPIGFAFTLAKLGRMDDARAELAKAHDMQVESQALRLRAELENAGLEANGS